MDAGTSPTRMTRPIADIRAAYDVERADAEARGDRADAMRAASRVADLDVLERFGIRMIDQSASDPAQDHGRVDTRLYDASVVQRIRDVISGRIETAPHRNPFRTTSRLPLLEAEDILVSRLGEIRRANEDWVFGEDRDADLDDGSTLRRQMAAVERRMILRSLTATSQMRHVGMETLEVTRDSDSPPLARCWNVIAGAYITVRSREFVIELDRVREAERDRAEGRGPAIARSGLGIEREDLAHSL